MSGLTAAVKERALAEGCDLVGVAAAAVVPGADRLQEWLAAGRHGDMSYLAETTALRTDPRLVLPGCRSVVMTAMSYHTSQPASATMLRPGRVWISRYAWGRDYHKVLKKRLVRLGRWLSHQVPGCTWRACVDTAPVTERSWAAQAGIGWIGKSTQLINRRLGSELFLGALLTDVLLTPDQPAEALCGSCTSCLDACPGGALVAPGVLDARSCSSYLTIEHRGPIPDDLQPGIGVNLAGCDICQEVCPWTREAPADLHAEFQPAAHRFNPVLTELESMQEGDYRAWRSGSPLSRISFAQLRRNLDLVRSNSARLAKLSLPE
jgi:epoxyqueuosine reductase